MSDHVSILDVSSEPVTLTIGDTVYAVSALGPGDHAKAEVFMRDQRLAAFVRQTRNTPMTDDARGIAIGRIMCEPVLLNDLLLSYQSRLYMLWLSLKKKTAGITLDQVHAMTEVTTSLLTTLMNKITGIGGDKETPGNVPFPPSADAAEVSTPPSDATTGQTN